MKRKFIGIFAVCTLLLTMIGCDEERTIYSGPNYIMFSDSLYVLPVQNNEELFDIPVSATQTCSYDRTLAVEILDKSSNAIEGLLVDIEAQLSGKADGTHHT